MIHLCVPGLSRRVLSFQPFRDLKVPKFSCCVLSSQSWLGGSPILNPVGTIRIKYPPHSGPGLLGSLSLSGEE